MLTRLKDHEIVYGCAVHNLYLPKTIALNCKGNPLFPNADYELTGETAFDDNKVYLASEL